MIPLRIFRSFHARYYDDDILYGPDAYPEEYFAALVEHGFNAVWLRGILRDLAATSVFPTLGREIARHQDALGLVVERAKRHGVQVLLYLNEPLGLPRDDPFWAAHPEARGASGDSVMDDWPETFAFCTSTPDVQTWLREVTANLFRAIPELGGWFLITGSEHHTHCYSHVWNAPGGDRPDCLRCAARDAAEVVADVITTLRDGTRAASTTAHTIAWNWGWTQFEPEPQPSLLARLPRDITLLLDWERGGQRLMPDGREIFIDEYSLSYTGPSERFQATMQEARRHGLAVMAKLQIGTTHELATVPNMPLIDQLYRKLVQVEELAPGGMLATWNFGNSFSLNTAAIARFAHTVARPSPEVFVRQLAAEYFPGAAPDGVAQAIAQLTAAMAWFPFSLNMLYWGPCNYALATPLTLAPLTGKPMAESWMMRERGDDLAPSLGPFTLEEVIACFSSLVEAWQQGVEQLSTALAGCAHLHAAQELGVARIIGCCYRSARNVYQVYRLRRERPADAEPQFRVIVADEIANLQAALPLIAADPRIGFHAECQGYQFDAQAVEKKLRELEKLS